MAKTQSPALFVNKQYHFSHCQFSRHDLLDGLKGITSTSDNGEHTQQGLPSSAILRPSH